MQKRVLVCGGRNFDDKKWLDEVLTTIQPQVIIHGGARGADRLAGEWAERNSVPCRVEFADWERYGRRAGHIRNLKMLTDFFPDLIVAFPGGKGTADMVRQAKAKGIKIYVPRKPKVIRNRVR